jgi:hypothetical protein
MATPEEMQAEIDALKNTASSNESKYAESQRVQRAFNNLPEVERSYLNAHARGENPAPLQPQAVTPEPPSEIDPDIDAGAAMRQLEERLTAQFEQKTQAILAMQDQKFNSVATPMLQMRAESSQASVKKSFDDQFGDGMFEKYRGKAAELASGNEALLQNEAGLTALLKAAIADDAISIGREQEATAKARRSEMADSIFGGPQPGTARGSDETDFTDLDWDNNPEGALAESFLRMSEGG